MALNKSLNFESLDGQTSHSTLQMLNYVTGVLVLLIAVSSALAALVGDSELALDGVVALVVIVVSYVAYLSILQNKIEEQCLATFLTDNDFQTTSTEGVDHVATSLLADGHSFKIRYAFNGVYVGQSFEARIVSYTTGYGKDSEVHSFVCLQFSIQQILPFIQVAAWQVKLLAKADMKPSIPGTTELQLEGKFNERYNVAVVPGTEQRVLQFMTPDFMEEILALGYGANIEFAGPNFFAIAAFQNATVYQFGTAIQTAFSVADACLKQMSDIARSWDAHAATNDLAEFAQSAQQPRLRLFASAPEPW